MNYDAMFNYVKKMLDDANATKSKKFSFRSRFEHIVRVTKWCMRLLPDCPECNRDILITSAIFHDVGYAYGQEDHASASANIFLDYAKENKFDKKFIEEVYKNVSLHSSKELLKDPNSSIELILLLEADLLDEEGALGITWDLMGEGVKNPTSYEQGLSSLWSHSGHILHQDYMVTPLAKKYWEEKKKFVNDFIQTLSKDLFIE